MSNFFSEAKRKKRDRFEPVEMLDDYYGKHKYAVRFANGDIYKEEDVILVENKPTKGTFQPGQRGIPNYKKIEKEQLAKPEITYKIVRFIFSLPLYLLLSPLILMAVVYFATKAFLEEDTWEGFKDNFLNK